MDLLIKKWEDRKTLQAHRDDAVTQLAEINSDLRLLDHEIDDLLEELKHDEEMNS